MIREHFCFVLLSENFVKSIYLCTTGVKYFKQLQTLFTDDLKYDLTLISIYLSIFKVFDM